MKKLKVAFIYNMTEGARDEQHAEWDSPETVSAIKNALERRAEVACLDAGSNIKDSIIRAAPDIVFNYAEGSSGEEREAEIPALLESLRIPYTGSGPGTMVNCLNKAKAKAVLAAAGINTPAWAVAESPEDSREWREFPCIVKPLWEGSSKGLHDSALAKTRTEAARLVSEITRKYSQPALIEKFLPGREFTAGVLGNGEDIRVLPPAEINHAALAGKLNPILSYEAKWVIDTPENPLDILSCPAKITPSLLKQLENISVKAFKALGCRDWCRIDIRLDDKGAPNILELNPIPGLLPDAADNSCLPAAARAAGMEYNDLISMVLSHALKRCGMERPL